MAASPLVQHRLLKSHTQQKYGVGPITLLHPPKIHKFRVSEKTDKSFLETPSRNQEMLFLLLMFLWFCSPSGTWWWKTVGTPSHLKDPLSSSLWRIWIGSSASAPTRWVWLWPSHLYLFQSLLWSAWRSKIGQRRSSCNIYFCVKFVDHVGMISENS